MIKVNVGDKVFRIKFEHHQYSQPTWVTSTTGRVVEALGLTTAIIIDEKDAVVAQEASICSIWDNFNKAKGRLEALKRATIELPREVRKAIFTGYLASGARIS